MRLGVLGGTFDPVHVGHLLVAEQVRECLQLDEVLFVPAGQPWFKMGQRVTCARHRLAMLELAVVGNLRCRVSDMEIRRPGPSYTADTLEELGRERGGEVELYVIVGLDALNQMHRWHEPQRVLDLATVVGIARPGVEDRDRDSLDSIRRGASKEVMVLKGLRIDISASDIRQRVSRGLSIRYRVPDEVASYIHEHGLYRGYCW